MDIITLFLLTASGFSTTYGYGEMMCGDIGKPRTCSEGATTASGEPFNPNLPTGAVFAPSWLRMRARVIPIRTPKGRCVFIRINDKGNDRYRNKRKFDITPASIRLMGGFATRYWSQEIRVCSKLLQRKLNIERVIIWNINNSIECN